MVDGDGWIDVAITRVECVVVDRRGCHRNLKSRTADLGARRVANAKGQVSPSPNSRGRTRRDSAVFRSHIYFSASLYSPLFAHSLIPLFTTHCVLAFFYFVTPLKLSRTACLAPRSFLTHSPITRPIFRSVSLGLRFYVRPATNHLITLVRSLIMSSPGSPCGYSCS